jgi:VWFA-related protein
MNPLWAALPLLLQQSPVFRTEVNVVRVEVLVTRDGVPVRGLRESDFELRDAGRRQTLEPILELETPVDALLLLDLSASVRGEKLAALEQAARTFLDGLRPGEQAGLLAFNHELQLVEPLNSDIGAVRRALEQAVSRGSTALFDAVYAALRLQERDMHRTAIVVFSDGLDTLSWLGPREVEEAARRSNATVYAVVVRQRGEPREAFLGHVTRATGGRLFETEDERGLEQRFRDVLADIRARYVLRYAPTSAGRAGWHPLDVRLKHVKADVLARPGYWVAAPER